MLNWLNRHRSKFYQWIFGLIGSVCLIFFIGLSISWIVAGLVSLAFILLGGAGWFLIRSRREQNRQAALVAELEQSLASLREMEQRRSEDVRRMQIILRLNQSLIQAGASTSPADENALMSTALTALTDLVGALGCSFVPVDEWQQPLPPFTHGQLPEPVLRAWANHLADGMLRERCGNCRVLRSTPGGCPLHPAQVGGALSVYCLSIPRAGSGSMHAEDASAGDVLGVLHLYLPAGRTLDPEMNEFLITLLRQIAAAYESVHLRSQELSTLRHIRMLHAQESDFTVSLSGLLEGLMQALEVDCIIIRLRPGMDDRLSNLTVQSGSLCGLEDLVDHELERVSHGEIASSRPGSLPVWLALPLSLPDGQVLGMLLAGVDHAPEFHPRQKAILQTVAAQAAQLVENERMVRSLEYKAVIQERIRLAREIHDGLAQTLAYLKLQAGQMQSYLAVGDLSRLGQVLKDNYQVLAEAYLDTRQAIDNLRLTPKDGLVFWLERTLDEFEGTTGLQVESGIEPRAAVRAEAIPLEIQAQLIRIVQESLSNIRKHARARKVVVALRVWQDDLVLEVGDDGLGFEASDVPEISRHGLRGMRERAELIGADFQVISQERKGTVVRLVLPSTLEEKTSS
jgi:two-component system nitrate/nitrite sensor histidine kinase NarX